MSSTISDLTTSFINCDKCLIETSDILHISRVIQACSQPVFAISVLRYCERPSRLINVFPQEGEFNRYLIIGTNEHIYVLDKHRLMTENIELLRFSCNFCRRTFFTSSEWLIHVNEMNCAITNPCRWFPKLYEIPSLNNLYYDQVMRSYYGMLRLGRNEVVNATSRTQREDSKSHPPPTYEEIFGDQWTGKTYTLSCLSNYQIIVFKIIWLLTHLPLNART